MVYTLLLVIQFELEVFYDEVSWNVMLSLLTLKCSGDEQELWILLGEEFGI